jgi:hypothetical protein
VAETEIDCIELFRIKTKNKQTDSVKATLQNSFYLYYASGERTELKREYKLSEKPDSNKARKNTFYVAVSKC